MTEASPRERLQPQRREPTWPLAVALLLGAASYANALGGEFVYDDHPLIETNPLVTQPGRLVETLRTNFWGDINGGSNYWRPAATLVFRGIHLLAGGKPAAYHLVSLLLHLAAVTLVFRIVRRLLRRGEHVERPAATVAAAAAASLFAVHPVHVEAVAWISGMMDLLFTVGALAFLDVHLARDERPARPVVYAGSLLALLAALLSKETAVVIPAITAAVDVASRRDALRTPGEIVRRWGGMAVVCAAYIGLRVAALGGLAPYRRLTGTDVGPRALDIAVAFGSALADLLVPASLSIVRERLTAPELLTMRGALFVATGVAVAALAAHAWRRNRTAAALGIATLLLPLVPTYAAIPILGTIPYSERYLYLPSVGFCVLLAVAGVSWTTASRRLRVVSAAAVGIVVLGFAAMSVARNRAWRDDLALWSDAVRKAPGVATAHVRHAEALLLAGDVAGATGAFAAAHRADPTVADRVMAAAVVAIDRGLFLDAALHLETVTRIRPNDVQARHRLGDLFDRMGLRPSALREFATIGVLDPTYYPAYVRTIEILLRDARSVDALEIAELAVKNFPDDARAERLLEQVKAALASGDAPMRTPPRTPASP